MIQLQNLHICIVYAKWEEKNREANRREATQEDTSASSAAQPRKGGGQGRRKASKEERIMLATLLSEPNKVPQVISSVLCGGKKGRKD
jgi:hypothetical protein